MDKEIIKEQLTSLLEKRLQSTGYVFYVEFIFMGRRRYSQMYYSQGETINRAMIADDLKKIYPEAQLVSFKKADFVPGQPLVVMRENLEEGMTMRDFKANRRKIKRRESSADAKKRGHVGKEWYNSGRTYSPDEAKSGRSNMPDHERSTRKRSAMDPEGEDSNYSADKTKNPKKLRKQKAMGEQKDHEVSMAQSQLSSAEKNIKDLKKKLGKKEKDIPAWMQAKITDTAHNMDAAATYKESAAWTKKSGKSEGGGLNEKGRKSYERENPGSDLKAPSKKVGNPRRASFCARMSGMKKKLTSAKTANDPDSRINKSLRAWNC